jgi:hypothetical protein
MLCQLSYPRILVYWALAGLVQLYRERDHPAFDFGVAVRAQQDALPGLAPQSIK